MSSRLAEAWLTVAPEFWSDGSIRSLTIVKSTTRYPRAVPDGARVVRVQLRLDEALFEPIYAPIVEIAAPLNVPDMRAEVAP